MKLFCFDTLLSMFLCQWNLEHAYLRFEKGKTSTKIAVGVGYDIKLNPLLKFQF